jgi:hypothetical protein
MAAEVPGGRAVGTILGAELHNVPSVAKIRATWLGHVRACQLMFRCRVWCSVFVEVRYEDST